MGLILYPKPLKDLKIRTLGQLFDPKYFISLSRGIYYARYINSMDPAERKKQKEGKEKG